MTRIEQLLPQLRGAARHSSRISIVDDKGEWTYNQLLLYARRIASGLLAGRDDLNEARCAFLAHPGFEYTAILWGIWSAGGTAVPIGMNYPHDEIAYVLRDSEAETLILTGTLESCAVQAASDSVSHATFRRLLEAQPGDLPRVSRERRAMILYTSGTTSKPKGVVTTHANIAAQISSLVQAWEWTAADRILNPLPLHHVHGIINILCCALWSGATCEMPPRFDAAKVFRALSGGRFTLFMAVPTIYAKLIDEWKRAGQPERERFSKACDGMRLMVSGSAALPLRVLEEWRSITGHTLLERYGMTETGMILSNPLHGVRKAGFVGQPLPGVEVKLIGDEGETLAQEGVPGEILVRGNTVFREYWRRPEATAEALRGGWFRTGDTAVLEGGSYRILGRTSVDILKVGGFKVSALEIEEALRDHPKIRECAVVGFPDDVWGERVLATVSPVPGKSIELAEIQEWAAKKLARQKIPTRLMLLDELPRNHLGKVVKPALRQLFESSTGRPGSRG